MTERFGRSLAGAGSVLATAAMGVGVAVTFWLTDGVKPRGVDVPDVIDNCTVVQIEAEGSAPKPQLRVDPPPVTPLMTIVTDAASDAGIRIEADGRIIGHDGRTIGQLDEHEIEAMLR